VTDCVDLPTYYQLVGFGALLGGFAGLLPTKAGAPTAVVFGLGCLVVARWI